MSLWCFSCFLIFCTFSSSFRASFSDPKVFWSIEPQSTLSQERSSVLGPGVAPLAVVLSEGRNWITAFTVPISRTWLCKEQLTSLGGFRFDKSLSNLSFLFGNRSTSNICSVFADCELRHVIPTFESSSQKVFSWKVQMKQSNFQMFELPATFDLCNKKKHFAGSETRVGQSYRHNAEAVIARKRLGNELLLVWSCLPFENAKVGFGSLWRDCISRVCKCRESLGKSFDKSSAQGNLSLIAREPNHTETRSSVAF